MAPAHPRSSSEFTLDSAILKRAREQNSSQSSDTISSDSDDDEVPRSRMSSTLSSVLVRKKEDKQPTLLELPLSSEIVEEEVISLGSSSPKNLPGAAAENTIQTHLSRSGLGS